MAAEAETAFFSYSRNDSEFALRLAEDLKAAGANVWLDQLDIEGGMLWDREVEKALANCPRMLVILSPNSANSDNVQDEVSFALSKQKRVIPVLYRECDIPFRLARLQHIDFRTDYARGLKTLLRTMGVEQQAAVGSGAAISGVPKESRTDDSDADGRSRTKEQARVGERPKMPGLPAWLNWKVALGNRRKLLSVAFATPQLGWAVGEGGTILHSEDGGRRWTPQTSSANEELYSVAFATSQLGWAVGEGETILHTEDGGRTWKRQAGGSAMAWLSSPLLYSVAFATPLLGWAVGQDGAILHTENGGGSWKPQTNGVSAHLLSVAFATPWLVWAVGSNGAILHTEDGGSTWKMQTSGTRASLLSVAFATPGFGWAVGEGGTILHTEDGGSTWKMQTSGTRASLLSVVFAWPQLGWAVGEGGTILHTEDGGSTWKMQTSGTRASLLSVVFAWPQLGWAVGKGATILHTQDGGGSWKP